MSEQTETHHIYSEDRMKKFGNTSFLGSVRLSGRLFIFVIIGVLAMAVAAGGYFLTEKRNKLVVENASNAARTVELVSDIEQKIWRAREEEKKLLKNRDAEGLADFEASVFSIAALLDSLYTRPDTRPVGELITTISEGLGQYIEAFNIVVNASLTLNPTGKKKAPGLEARLTKSAGAVEKRINKTRRDGLINVMADMRKAEKDFIISGSSQDLVRIKKGFDKFSNLIGRTKLPKKEKPLIIALMKSYQKMVGSYANARLTQKKGMNRIDEIFTYLSPSVENLSAFAKDALAAAEQAKGDFKDMSRIGVPAVSLGLLFLLTIAGLTIMQSMAAPIRTIATTAASMVEGRDIEAVPVLGNADEVGDLARALANLKASLLRADLLRQDLKTKSAIIEKPAADPEEMARLKKQLAAAEENSVGGAGRVQAAERKVDGMKAKIETLQTEVEKGEAAVIEAALLRMDLENTKAELDRTTDALMRVKIPKTPEAAAPPAEAEEQQEQQASEALPGSISSISHQVAQSSESVSAAARDAERTGAMMRGLTGAAKKITEVGNLLNQINEQTDLLVMPPPKDGNRNSNLVVLASGLQGGKGGGERTEGIGIERRFDIIRTAANQATWAVREIDETIAQVKEVAAEIAEASSAEALEVTAELLEQSEHLRGMLDSLIDKIQTSPIETANGGANEKNGRGGTPEIDDNSA